MELLRHSHVPIASARAVVIGRSEIVGKPRAVFEKIKSLASRLRQPVIACLGLSYKADIDDMRESPALDVVEMLARDNVGELLVVEPNVDRLPKGLSDFTCVRHCELQPALKSADIIVLLVDHRQFKRVDRELLNLKIVVDTRGLWR